MNILIDVDALVLDGTLSAELAQKLRASAVRSTGSTAINILLAFGAVAIAAGILVLWKSTALIGLFGLVFTGLGYFLHRSSPQWSKLGSIWMVIGGLILSAYAGYYTPWPALSPLVSAAILLGVGVLGSSHLLIALVPLALCAVLGGRTDYMHAMYMIAIQEPTLTIITFTALGSLAWTAAQRGFYAALSITFARTCVLLVNFGFWIGSLWGDTPGRFFARASDGQNYVWAAQQTISAPIYSILWAVALVAAGYWGAVNGRRFLVNTVAVFGAIHFYTQWFERMGAEPVAVIVAGAITIVIGLAFWKFNQRALANY